MERIEQMSGKKAMSRTFMSFRLSGEVENKVIDSWATHCNNDSSPNSSIQRYPQDLSASVHDTEKLHIPRSSRELHCLPRYKVLRHLKIPCYEAYDPIRVDFRVLVHEWFIHAMYPFSIPYVYIIDGMQGLLKRHMWGWTFNAESMNESEVPPIGFLIVQNVLACLRFGFVAIVVTIAMTDEQGLPVAFAPEVVGFAFTMGWVHFAIALKIASRPGTLSEQKNRFFSHAERRDEEILFGWLLLPAALARFEIEVAALRHHLSTDAVLRFAVRGMSINDGEDARVAVKETLSCASVADTPVDGRTPTKDDDTAVVQALVPPGVFIVGVKALDVIFDIVRTSRIAEKNMMAEDARVRNLLLLSAAWFAGLPSFYRKVLNPTAMSPRLQTSWGQALTILTSIWIALATLGLVGQLHFGGHVHGRRGGENAD
eukprot:GEMP01022312.1.p1 GENE.GEMP01022312.1~~GEMP01022312.1.p1  ORF type:complete len:428 (+),score=92.86 GEMP01022312.1:143-1426(+)